MKEGTLFLGLAFMAITIFTIFQFFRSTGHNKNVLLTLLGLMTYQSLLVFLNVDTQIRVPLVLLPVLVLILWLFLSKKGKQMLEGFDFEKYTWLHTIRVGVEFVLLGLFLQQLIPQSMTFEGRNFDILSGLTAPLIAWFGYRKQKIGATGILLWNIACLLLVSQVVITGLLSAPTPVQQLSFDQPNVGILYFPFIFLAGIVVPIVMIGHIAEIRKYWLGIRRQETGISSV